MEKECKDCWHNYHCPMPQEGYDYHPDTINKELVELAEEKGYRRDEEN